MININKLASDVNKQKERLREQKERKESGYYKFTCVEDKKD